LHHPRLRAQILYISSQIVHVKTNFVQNTIQNDASSQFTALVCPPWARLNASFCF
jgi:hypothetical protein